MKNNKKCRYVIYKNGERLSTECDSIVEVCEVIECSRQHFYTQVDNGYLTHKGIDYKIVDRLSKHYHEMMMMNNIDNLFNI